MNIKEEKAIDEFKFDDLGLFFCLHGTTTYYYHHLITQALETTPRAGRTTCHTEGTDASSQNFNTYTAGLSHSNLGPQRRQQFLAAQVRRKIYNKRGVGRCCTNPELSRCMDRSGADTEFTHMDNTNVSFTIPPPISNPQSISDSSPMDMPFSIAKTNINNNNSSTTESAPIIYGHHYKYRSNKDRLSLLTLSFSSPTITDRSELHKTKNNCVHTFSLIFFSICMNTKKREKLTDKCKLTYLCLTVTVLQYYLACIDVLVVCRRPSRFLTIYSYIHK